MNFHAVVTVGVGDVPDLVGAVGLDEKRMGIVGRRDDRPTLVCPAMLHMLPEERVVNQVPALGVDDLVRDPANDPETSVLGAVLTEPQPLLSPIVEGMPHLPQETVIAHRQNLST